MDVSHDATELEIPVDTSNPTVSLLGADPWARFDVWAARVWEASSNAVRIAESNGPDLGDSMDSRVLTSLNQAQIAKDIAEMVNPLFAIAHAQRHDAEPSHEQAPVIITMSIDEDD